MNSVWSNITTNHCRKEMINDKYLILNDKHLILNFMIVWKEQSM